MIVKVRVRSVGCGEKRQKKKIKKNSKIKWENEKNPWRDEMGGSRLLSWGRRASYERDLDCNYTSCQNGDKKKKGRKKNEDKPQYLFYSSRDDMTSHDSIVGQAN